MTSARRRHDLMTERQNASEAQRRAAAPDTSVWVGASAGTGKTKVLTDRVLRLLLPREDGAKGTPPARILCLTYTKAAASEMALRLNRILSAWATVSHERLDRQLYDLLGRPPRLNESEAARRLFAQVVDAPGGLKIMTIHAFCQSVLGRFPLEAGLPPQFTALEEPESAGLLTEARDIVLARAQARADGPEGRALDALAAEQTEDQFNALLRGLTAERHQLQHSLARLQDQSQIYGALCRSVGVDPGDTVETLARDACRDGRFDRAKLQQACAALIDAGGTLNLKIAAALQPFLEANETDRNFEALLRALTSEDKDNGGLKPRSGSHLGSAAANKIMPDCSIVLRLEAERLVAVAEKIAACHMAALTRDLIILGHAVTVEYQRLKDRRSALDFDDLIFKTKSLLENDMAAWVLYKLDEGLDHILIDEAQDTNPEQWDIANILTDEFFSGVGARDVSRTIFVVGDGKQSIYSFQRANLEKFAAMRMQLKAKVEGAAQTWRDVPLTTSFRSTPSILDFVDSVFARPENRKGLGETAIEHASRRHAEAGMVEIWPLFKVAPSDRADTWAPALDIRSNRKASTLLAAHMASTVAGWLADGEILPSRDRPVQPGDILILVRHRSAFVNGLIRALKQEGVPVSGLDRMVLNEQLAVMDLAAVAQTALLPEDHLTLACVLKSPFIGWDDQRLEDLALSRGPGESLWSALRARGETAVVQWLNMLIRHAGLDRPYEFFSRLLQSPCPNDAISGLHAISARLGDEALDPLNEFLNQALTFERRHVPALQLFLVWQSQGEEDIKREQEEAGGKVRIMTVHASKGLQAPIVFLPDTVHGRAASGHSAKRLLWPDKTGLGMPLWSPRKQAESAQYRSALQRVQAREDDEYRRLLYVAITRAEDRLYVCGYQGRNAVTDDSWYAMMRAAMGEHADAETFDFEGPEGLDRGDALHGMRLRNAQTKTAPPKPMSTTTSSPPDLSDPAYGWVYAAPAEESVPPRPLNPSRPLGEDVAAQSPLAGGDAHRFRRGLVTHRLLQTLPDLPEDRRESAAAFFAAQPVHALPEDVQQSIVREVLAVLNHPDYAPLFGPESRAELPVTGMAGDTLVSGQIDRLAVMNDEVWIVDYKTNRPPPDDEGGIPEVYRRQLAAYAGVLAGLWPGRAIRTFLLWTDGARLMEVKAVKAFSLTNGPNSP